ncbi:alpha/beta-hydrolase [Cryphonectria parasitica EP155]|uniref:Alpha/beta-hydrolase n=1 Tax=Cryphonectria parasitica (strain ATCC 38755 / EP155) TaxID=660469 RepID=A0A9P4YEG8_CRYP1|nr:alpha/beta-hydrolase [Cryphonectria parasitica EP155]KAF3771385.1 alpha/beta-hydrolase [Cryphonectria parasitica EP155]
MVTKTVAPYGEWESEISLEDATAGTKGVSSPRSDVETGRVFYLEAKPDGASTIVEVVRQDDGSYKLVHVLPEPHGVGTAVYEYGGGAYDVLPSSANANAPQRIIFSDAQDGNAVKILDVDAGRVTTLVSNTPWLRYADFGPSRDPGATAKWVLAVEEDHTHPAPQDVKNYVVAINIDTGAVKKLVSGADFYTGPRYSHDGQWVSWRRWNHPDMAWTRSQLCVAEVLEVENGAEIHPEHSSVIAGGKFGEAVGDGMWAPDGAVYFPHEVEGSDWRHLYRFYPGHKDATAEKLKLKGLDEVEVGDCSMSIDQRTFCFLSENSLVLAYSKYATYSTIHVNLKTLEVTPLDVPLVETRRDPIAAVTSNSFVVIGAGITRSLGVYVFSLDDQIKATMVQVAKASSKEFSDKIFSRPEHIHFTSKKDPKRPIHGFYWPPHNPNFTAPEGTLPPLLIMPHGGPTGHTCPGLQVGTLPGTNFQLYTSRGFAYFSINYTGSSGHGKAYRQRLDAQWGILDRDDVVESVDYLSSTGRADRARVGIHGGSAGGYNVLQSLVWYPDVFAAGACYCGISDVQTMREGTHKLESRYLDGLFYAPGLSDEEKEKVNYERSPLNHAERITSPLLLIHGDKDTVVPVQQSYDIEKKVRENGGDVELLVAPGEGHMFKKKASLEMALKSEFAWFMRTLVRK